MRIGAIIFGVYLGGRGLWFLIFVSRVVESRLDRARVFMYGTAMVVSATLALLGAFVFTGATGALLVAALGVIGVPVIAQTLIRRVKNRREEKAVSTWVDSMRKERQ